MVRLFFFTLLSVVALPARAANVTDVKIEEKAGRTEVVITASEPLTFQSWTQKAPPTVVIDMLDTAATPKKIPGKGLVQAADLSRHDGRGTSLSRLSLPLVSAQPYEVTAHGNTITISIGVASAAPASATASGADFGGNDKPVLLASRELPERIVEGSMGRATATDAPLLAQARGARQMTYIGFKNSPSESRIFARMNDKAEFAVRKEGENLLVLEIQNATVPLRNNKNHLDTRYFDSPVKMITPSEVEDATPTVRITIEMKESVPYETKVEGRDIVIVFKKR